jgi:hypothetical protein
MFLSNPIYRFRGAKSKFLGDIRGAADLPLTVSFRFGPGLAAVANAILFVKEHSPQLKLFRPYRVRGGSRRCAGEAFGHPGGADPVVAVRRLLRAAREAVQGGGEKSGSVTVLAHANLTLIRASLNLLTWKPDLRVAIAGGASSSAKQRYIAACKEVADVFALYTGEKNSLPDTPRFREFHDEHGKPRAELTYEQFKRECQDRELNQFTLHVAGP